MKKAEFGDVIIVEFLVLCLCTYTCTAEYRHSRVRMKKRRKDSILMSNYYVATENRLLIPFEEN